MIKLNCTEIHLGKRDYTCALSPQFLSAMRKPNLESIFQKLNFRNKSCFFFKLENETFHRAVNE